MTGIDQCRFGVATASLGMAPSHTLSAKFAALQQAGFKYSGVGFGDYMAWVREQRPDLPASTCPPEWAEAGEPDPDDKEIWDAMLELAPKCIAFAGSHGLKIVGIQPLNQFDGWPPSSLRAAWVRRKAEKWIELCSRLEVELIQVGANDFAEANASDSETAEDLRWLAELGARQSPPVKIAYEVWCFSKRVNTWEKTWELVQLADHPNLGLCMDVAHFPLAPAYGWDPVTGKGWTEEDFQGVLERVRKVPAHKIFFVEVSDVLEPSPPLGQGSEFDEWRIKNRPARGDNFVWVVCARPVPFVGRNAGRNGASEEEKKATRVVESLKAILSTGFEGPIMFEFFEALYMEKDDPSVPLAYAEACNKALAVLKKELS